MNVPDTSSSASDAGMASKKSLHPKHWTTHTKIIASIAALALVLTGVGGVFAYHAYTVERDCAAQAKVFIDQKDGLDKAVQEAHDALSSVDASLKIGEGKRLAHTDGFPTSPEGQTAITDLDKALDKADKYTKNSTPACSTGDDLDALANLTSARHADLDALKTQTAAFIDVRDKYRLTKAADEAQSSMDTAKADLAAAQKAATDQLAVVDGDAGLQGNATVKAAYDALKQTENDSHSVSTTVTASTYEEAVGSIEKAKTVVAKTDEVNTATQALKDAITAYQDAKAAEEAAAQAAAAAQAQAQTRSSTTRGSGSNSYSSSGSSRSGSGSYTAPAPAAPSGNGGGNGGGASRGGSSSNSGSGSKSDSSGFIDLGPGAPDQKAPGCMIMEGKEYCNP